MNTHESYVSLETAKLLKQAGFDWEVEQWFEILENGKPMYAEGITYNMNSEIYGGSTISMPTLSVAQRWLREAKGYIVLIEPPYSESNGIIDVDWLAPFIYNKHESKREYSSDDAYDSYEEALESGIKKCLELILEEKE